MPGNYGYWVWYPTPVVPALGRERQEDLTSAYLKVWQTSLMCLLWKWTRTAKGEGWTQGSLMPLACLSLLDTEFPLCCCPLTSCISPPSFSWASENQLEVLASGILLTDSPENIAILILQFWSTLSLVPASAAAGLISLGQTPIRGSFESLFLCGNIQREKRSRLRRSFSGWSEPSVPPGSLLNRLACGTSRGIHCDQAKHLIGHPCVTPIKLWVFAI